MIPPFFIVICLTDKNHKKKMKFFIKPLDNVWQVCYNCIVRKGKARKEVLL